MISPSEQPIDTTPEPAKNMEHVSHTLSCACLLGNLSLLSFLVSNPQAHAFIDLSIRDEDDLGLVSLPLFGFGFESDHDVEREECITPSGVGSVRGLVRCALLDLTETTESRHPFTSPQLGNMQSPCIADVDQPSVSATPGPSNAKLLAELAIAHQPYISQVFTCNTLRVTLTVTYSSIVDTSFLTLRLELLQIPLLLADRSWPPLQTPPLAPQQPPRISHPFLAQSPQNLAYSI
jgi:hypothetical protein